MAQVRKPCIVLSLNHELFIATGMKAVPIAREATALRPELCPPFLPIQRIHLFLVSTGVVIDHHIGIEAYVVFMRLGNQRLKLGAVPIERLGSPLLIMVPKIEVVVWVISIRAMIGGLRDRR